MLLVRYLDLKAAFSTNAIHAPYLFLVPSEVSRENIAAWMMVCSTITAVKKLASLTTYLTCSSGIAPGPFKAMLGLCKWSS